MSEYEKRTIITPGITKIANTFNHMPLNSTIEGMKVASFLEKQIKEAEKIAEEKRANPVKQQVIIPTGDEIRKAREEGIYR